MKRNRLNLDMDQLVVLNDIAKKDNRIDNSLYGLSEKNDNPDFLNNFAEPNQSKVRARRRISYGQEEKLDEEITENQDSSNSNNNNNSSNSNNNSIQSSTSSITNAISNIIVPFVAVAACSGIVPGLESINTLDVLNTKPKEISASIVSIESTDMEAKYNLTLDFNIDTGEYFVLEDKDVSVTLTNDFVNSEQKLKYDSKGTLEQEYVVDSTGSSNITSKYSIRQVAKEEPKGEDTTVKYAFKVNGVFEGLTKNMSYTLSVKSKGKTLAQKSFKTKAEEEILPFEIVNSQVNVDTYRDIASFEITVDAKNWSDEQSFNDEEFVLRVSNGSGKIDFNLSTDYNHMLKQNVDLIYSLSQNLKDSGDISFNIRGDISKLDENSSYNLTILRKEDIVAENSFETTSKVESE